MFALMAKKKPSRAKPDSKRTTGVDRHTTPRLAFHLPKEMLDEFKQHVGTLSPKPTESAVLRDALRFYLESKRRRTLPP